MQILTAPGSIAEMDVHYLLDPANPTPPLLYFIQPLHSNPRAFLSPQKKRASNKKRVAKAAPVARGMNYFLVRPLEALGAGEDVIALASSRCLILRSVVTLLFLAP